MDYNFIEYIIIIGVIAFQTTFFFETREKMDYLKKVVPNVKNDHYFLHSDDNNVMRIFSTEENEIIESINKYLEKNKGAVADFNLLKDITQRNIDTVEEEINMTIQLPVYIGLAGTMAGIILGLFGLPDINSQAFLDGGVDKLINGVKIAMIASFSGLLLTVINTGFKLKNLKLQVEKDKNIFYTFLQTELLPSLSESITSGIIDLNRTVERFGVIFNINVNKLDALMNRNYDSLMAQQVAVEALNNIDITQIAKFNINVLGEIRKSMDSLEKLSYSFKNLDSFVANSKNIVDRTNDVIGFSDKIEQMLNQSLDLQKFLYSHFKQLEDRGQIINDTVLKLDDVVDKSLKGLESHIHERIQAVRDIKITTEDLLKQEFDENRNVLTKLNFLEPLSKEFNQYSKSDIVTQKEILVNFKDIIKQNTVLQQKMANNNDILEKVLNQLQKSSLSNQIRRIFKSKKIEEQA